MSFLLLNELPRKVYSTALALAISRNRLQVLQNFLAQQIDVNALDCVRSQLSVSV
eukprot:m.108333 g.108333  ORF g.108333 m.108333 type:complete len:55 (+) comp51737_c1_seq3:540-704(+)